ncbi:class I SAM-dependent methyltransferase [Pseudalkalibacillus caeni]|uniref:Class I SAM-dependent methyltransferase n=1 Tax=Exobacillus caeni TaxID=2574798 RepID=A0A5R9F5Q0_9BACL|nr:class I SAM-dependent methyltransferase [Pseudalkalibacillus caeni]TLS36958.1 class I SAM-dependent methyltransferase [Pseudalkalibacillus caeni]
MLLKKFRDIIDSQYRMPSGLLGWYIGEKMNRQHKTETNWTINLLNLQENEDILDIGCGAGYAIKLLLDESPTHRVTGIDLSKTLINSAKRRNYKKITNKRASFVLGNVNNLPFKDRQFSRVFSIHSIYFWGDLQGSINEIHRVLKPTSSLCITLCDGKNGVSWEGITKMIHSQLLPLLEEAGFKNVRIIRGPLSRKYHTLAVTGEL